MELIFVLMAQAITQIPDTPTDIWSKIGWIVSVLMIVVFTAWDKIKDFLNNFLSRKHEIKKIELEKKETEKDLAKEALKKRAEELVKECQKCQLEKTECKSENYMLKQKIANIKTGFDFLYILCIEAFADSPRNKKQLMKYKEYIDDANVD